MENVLDHCSHNDVYESLKMNERMNDFLNMYCINEMNLHGLKQHRLSM